MFDKIEKFHLESFVLIIFVLFIGCNDRDPKLPDSGLNSDLIPGNSEKQYSLDEYGNLVSTQISIGDFSQASTCSNTDCHPQHYAEWSQSMHAYSMKDPIFFRGMKGWLL